LNRRSLKLERSIVITVPWERWRSATVVLGLTVVSRRRTARGAVGSSIAASIARRVRTWASALPVRECVTRTRRRVMRTPASRGALRTLAATPATNLLTAAREWLIAGATATGVPAAGTLA
jgi:hypothetical protein